MDVKIPNKPKLKTIFNWVPMSEGSIQIRSFSNIYLMTGKSIQEIIPKLIPMLDGLHTREEIHNALPEIGAEAIDIVIHELAKYYLVEDATALESSKLSEDDKNKYKSQIEYYSLFADRALPNGEIVSKYRIMEELVNSKCLLVGLGNVGLSIAEELADSNIGYLLGYDTGVVTEQDVGKYAQRGDLGKKRTDIFRKVVNQTNNSVKVDVEQELIDLVKQADFIIMATDLALAYEYEQINDICIKEDKPWLSVRVMQTEIEVGPLIIPDQTPCFTCYTSRLNGNASFFDENQEFEKFKQENSSDMLYASIPPIYKIAAGLVGIETIKYLTKIIHPMSVSRLLTYNILTMELKSHSILKLPRCTSCGKLINNPAIAPYSVFLV